MELAYSADAGEMLSDYRYQLVEVVERLQREGEKVAYREVKDLLEDVDRTLERMNDRLDRVRPVFEALYKLDGCDIGPETFRERIKQWEATLTTDEHG